VGSPFEIENNQKTPPFPVEKHHIKKQK